MHCRIAELFNKEVICIKSGACLGRVCDVEVDTCGGQLAAIVVYGRGKFFGFFGREDDCVIKWCDIEVIGEDTVLVRIDPPFIRRKKGQLLGKIFG